MLDFVLFEPRAQALEIDGVGDVPVPTEVLNSPAYASPLVRIEKWARSNGIIGANVRVAQFGAM